MTTMDLLQNLSMVCKHLRNLILDGSAIRYLELTSLPTQQNSLDRLIEILKNSRSIRGIKIIWDDFKHDVSKWPIQNDVMNKVCLQALKSSKNLKSLKLSFKDLSAFKLHPETITVPPTVGPNSKVKGPLRRLGFCLTYIWVSSKNSEIKYSTDGPLR